MARDGSQGRWTGRLKDGVATGIRRAFLTLTACVMALAGAEDAFAAGVAVAAGFVLDLVRNARAPDLRRPARDWAASIREAAGDDGAAARHRALYRRRTVPVLALAWGYGLFWILAEPALPQGLKDAVFAAFSPLADLVAGVFEIQRRHVGGLAGLGLPDRAALTAHLYSTVFALLSLLVWLQASGGAFHGAHALARRELTVAYPDEAQKRREVGSSWRYGVTFFAMGSVFYVVTGKIIELRGEEFSRYDWGLQASNLPFLIFLGLYSSAFYCFGQSYCYFILHKYKRMEPGEPPGLVPARRDESGG